MKKSSRLDAFIDVMILAALIFTISVVIEQPIIRFLLVVLGCGAMYNNVKYIIKRSKKKTKKKDDKTV